MELIGGELHAIFTWREIAMPIRLNTAGSAVGSSFFIVCNLSDLTKQRGGFRHIVKIEEKPRRGQMLVGFLNSADELPETVNAQFAGATIIDLEQFTPICDTMK
jgi:hypothetical protein